MRHYYSVDLENPEEYYNYYAENLERRKEDIMRTMHNILRKYSWHTYKGIATLQMRDERWVVVSEIQRAVSPMSSFRYSKNAPRGLKRALDSLEQDDKLIERACERTQLRLNTRRRLVRALNNSSFL